MLVDLGKSIDVGLCSASSPGIPLVFPLHPSGKIFIEVLPEAIQNGWIEPAVIVVPATKYGIKLLGNILQKCPALDLNVPAPYSPAYLFEYRLAGGWKEIQIDLSLLVHASSGTEREA